MAEISNSTLFHSNTGIPGLKDACIVIIKTEWNAAIVNDLEKGCTQSLKEAGVSDIHLITVPGAIEITFAIKQYWELKKNSGHLPAAFIALGCVMRGGTPHFEYVCKSVTEGITQLNLSLPVPVVFGVLTVDNEQQARDRSGGELGNKGNEAAVTALKMIQLVESFKNKMA